MLKSADWAQGDPRQDLFPDLHADGRMTPSRAAELKSPVVQPIKTCVKCGSSDWRQYPDLTKGGGFFKLRCHPCKLQEPRDNSPNYAKLKAARRAKKINATPKWLSRRQLDAVLFELTWG